MTLPRALLITGILLGSAFCVLAFGNPQWKWCYVFQAYYLKKGTVIPSYFGGADITLIPIPHDYSGVWFVWGPDAELSAKFVDVEDSMVHLHGYNSGVLQAIFRTKRDPKDRMSFSGEETIFDRHQGIDRRAEFGIPVE